MRSIHLRVLVTVALLAVAGASMTAGAHHQPTVPTYTACLNTSTGVFSRLKQGNEPLGSTTCPSGQTKIHLSSGDITGILTATGSGLTGGGTNGTPSLQLDFANLDSRYLNQGASTDPLTWRGTWTSTASYASGDVVARNGESYFALTANSAKQPTSTSSVWKVLALKGATGAAGAEGAEGPVGPPILNWLGEWDAAAYYSTSDTVTYNGTSYLLYYHDGSFKNAHPDLHPDIWSIVAAAGAPGNDSTFPRTIAGAFGEDCSNLDGLNVSVTFYPGDGSCAIHFPPGTVGGTGTPFIDLTWRTLLGYNFFDEDGWSYIVVLPNTHVENGFFLRVKPSSAQP